MNIRKADLEDVALLRKLESKLVAYERSIEPTIKQTGQLEYYDIPALIEDNENSIVLIAEVDDIPVGCGMSQIRKNDHWNSEAQHGYIGLMFVEESQRGKNIGGLIIKELISWLDEKGIKEIRLKVFASNPTAVRAYEKYGFKHYVHEMIWTKNS